MKIIPGDYSEHKALNASVIKLGVHSMKKMHYAITHPIDEPTAAMRLGSAAHYAINEPHKLATHCVIWDGRKQGKAWDAFETENERKTIVSPAEMENAVAMSAAVYADADAASLIRGTKLEQPIYWSDARYGAAKARPDNVGDGYFLDVKTVTPNQFALHRFDAYCFGFRYYIQFGFYSIGLRANLGGTSYPKCRVIFVENAPPFDVVCAEVDEGLMDYGRSESVRIAAQYRACEKSGVFPGISPGRRIVLSAPTWAAEQMERVPTEEMDAEEL